jgi:hypothetical protein
MSGLATTDFWYWYWYWKHIDMYVCMNDYMTYCNIINNGLLYTESCYHCKLSRLHRNRDTGTGYTVQHRLWPVAVARGTGAR